MSKLNWPCTKYLSLNELVLLCQVVSAGVGRPQAVVGTSGQYYLMSSQLCCNTCQAVWFADSPNWLKKLPAQFSKLLPVFLTHKKGICKSVMDELRCNGKSPADMANQVNELMHYKYDCAHLAYLQAIHNSSNTKAAADEQNIPHAFGSYDSPDGWCGITVSSLHLTDLLEEIRHPEPVTSDSRIMVGQDDEDNKDTEVQLGLVQAVQLWQTFTAGDERISAPVVTMDPAFVSPPAMPSPDLSTLTQRSAVKLDPSQLYGGQLSPPRLPFKEFVAKVFLRDPKDSKK